MAYCLTSSCQQQSISPEHGAKRERDKIVTKSVWGKFILPEPLVPKSKPDVWKMVTIVTMSQTRSVDMFFGGECARVKYNYIIFIYIYMCTVGFLFPNAELIPKVLGQTWCALVIFFWWAECRHTPKILFWW